MKKKEIKITHIYVSVIKSRYFESWINIRFKITKQTIHIINEYRLHIRTDFFITLWKSVGDPKWNVLVTSVVPSLFRNNKKLAFQNNLIFIHKHYRMSQDIDLFEICIIDHDFQSILRKNNLRILTNDFLIVVFI